MKKLKITKNALEIFDNLPVYIMANDKDFYIHFWNKALEEATGYRKEEVIGRKEIIEKFYPDPIERKRKLKRWKEGEWKGKTWEAKIYSKFGTPIYMLIHEISDVITSESDIFWGVGVDITEYKKAYEKYKTFVDLTSEGIWYFALDEPVDTTLPEDEQLRLFFERAYLAECNDSYAKMYGFSSPEEIIGVRLKDIMPPDDQENMEYLRMVIRNNYAVKGAESVEYDNEGRKKYLLNNLVGVRDGKFVVGAWGSQVDITKIKEIEEELIYKEKLISNILSSVSGYIWQAEIDKNKKIKLTYISDSIEKITGYTPKEILYEREKIPSYAIEKNHLEIIRKAIEKAERNEDDTFDISITKRDKKKVYLRNIISTRHENNIIYVDGIGFDVTELKRIREKLKESEKFYSTIIDTIPDAFFLHKLDGTIVDINKTAIEMFMCSKNDLTGKKVSLISGTGYTDELARQKIEEALEKGYIEFEWVSKRLNGEEFPVRVRLKKINISGENYVMALVTDISREKEAIKKLKESEEKFRKLAENPLAGMTIIGKNGKFLYVNKRLADMFGYTQEELIGKKKPLDLTSEESKNVVKKHIEDRLSGEVNSIEYLFKGLRKDGKTIDVRAFGSVFEFKGERAIAAILIDETEKIEAEKRKKELEAQLFQAQKMEAIGLLASGIAHDFNNILGGILGYASYIKNLYKDDEKLISKIELIEKAAIKASDLTNKLLGFARKGKYTETIIDIGKAVKNVITILKRTIPRRIKVETYLPEKTLFIKGDENQIEQVVLNLATNAIDAMKDKGVLKIKVNEISVEENFVSTHLEAKEGSYVCITVEDTGEGIPEQIKDRIFEPFFTTKPPGKGTGLGLAMVYGIVKNHGGFISLYSEVGKGTTFKVYLPSYEEKVEEVQPYSQESLELIGQKRKILVVDDEEIIRDMLKDVLEALDFKVIIAKNGKEAIEKYNEEIDLVLIDMNMPEMGGKETFYALKGKYPNVKAIVCTGYSIDYNTRELLKNGAKGFLHKPFNMEELKRKIKEVLEE